MERRAFSTPNTLIMKINEVNRYSNFYFIARAIILFWMEARDHGKMMSNAIIAVRLLAAEATNNII